MSDLQGPCHVCGMRLGRNTCRNCGKLTCDQDFDKASGLCSVCRHGRSVKSK